MTLTDEQMEKIRRDLTAVQRLAIYEWLNAEADWADFRPSTLWEKAYPLDGAEHVGDPPVQ